MKTDIILYKNAAKDDPYVLTYSPQPLSKSQSRLKGRQALVPDINLSAYLCNAVFDWIEIQLVIVQGTQHQWIGNIFEKHCNRRPHVTSNHAMAGNVSHFHLVRVQEPDFKKVKEALAEIDQKYLLNERPTINGLEISIDFYPHDKSEQARALLYGALVRHLFVSSTRFETNMDWPRFTHGKLRLTEYTISGSSALNATNKIIRMSPEKNVAALYGSTYFIGRKDSPDVSWRIMNKTMDTQNIAAGTFTTLLEDEIRVRMEITLGQLALKEAGLNKFDDLSNIKLTQNISRLYFQMRLPTFSIQKSTVPSPELAVNLFFEKFRLDAFKTAGVIALDQMDKATLEGRKARRSGMRTHLAAQGKKMPAEARIGGGVNGSLVLWEAMSRKIEYALRHLEERARAAFS